MQGDGAAILILGGSGQVGTALKRQRWPSDMSVHSPSRHELDITNREAIANAIVARRYCCVVNCAAYTAVDAAENDVDAARFVNVGGPTLLAAATAKVDIPLIHLSTDYVFDGKSTSPYQPSDSTQPLSAYGQSKADGEDGVRETNSKHIVLRTSWVISPYGKNFVKTMLALAAKREAVKVVNDQYGRPTSADDLAAALQIVIRKLIEVPNAPFGTYHFANAGRTTWHDLAVATMLGARRRGASFVPIEAISSSVYNARAVRPRNTELCTSDITRDFGVIARPWPAALDDILDSLIGPARQDLG